MKIGIIGLGLIGGCLGIDFRAAGHTVYGLARKEASCQQAIARGIVDAASTHIESLCPCEVIFVCTPIATIVSMVKQLAAALSPTTIITDVGSVKAAIATEATQHWPQFVGGHPMSGKSEAGLEAAEAGLFQGNPYVITPIESADVHTDLAAVEVIEQLAKQLGSRLYRCAPHAHDRAVAWISHLPVMVSANLIEVALREPDPQTRALAQHLASSGFRDTSRVGGGNPELGLMMAQYNQAEIVRSLKRYQQAIADTIGYLEAEDWAKLSEKLTQTKAGRSLFVEARPDPSAT
ncbi:MAG: prephenate/arogenate dehydrogenase [Cyanobacteria bacterium J06606_4]